MNDKADIWNAINDLSTRISKLEELFYDEIALLRLLDEANAAEKIKHLELKGQGPDTGNYEFCWKVVMERWYWSGKRLEKEPGYYPLTDWLAYPARYNCGEQTRRKEGFGPYTAFDTLENAKAFNVFVKRGGIMTAALPMGRRPRIMLAIGKPSRDRSVWGPGVGPRTGAFPKGTRFYDEIILLEEGPDAGNYEFCWKVVSRDRRWRLGDKDYAPAIATYFDRQIGFRPHKWTARLEGFGPYTAFDTQDNAVEFATHIARSYAFPLCVFLAIGKPSGDRGVWRSGETSVAADTSPVFPKGTRFYDEIMLLEEINKQK